MALSHRVPSPLFIYSSNFFSIKEGYTVLRFLIFFTYRQEKSYPIISFMHRNLTISIFYNTFAA